MVFKKLFRRKNDEREEEQRKGKVEEVQEDVNDEFEELNREFDEGVATEVEPEELVVDEDEFDAPIIEEEPVEEAPALAKEKPKRGLFARLKEGLSKTRKGFVGKVDNLLSGRTRIDEDLLEELEDVLIQADVGVQTTMELVDWVREQVKARKITDPASIKDLLEERIREILSQNSAPLATGQHPTVYVVVGVNGAGKTTTIGKLAHRFKAEGKRVLLGAGDTFRAAAIEQLEEWSKRAGVEIIKNDAGSDPAAVAFDTVAAGKARSVDMVIIDTAGRLQTKSNLMNELGKVYRVVEKGLERPADEVLLVVDATTGQNAMSQAKIFKEAVPLSGVILTKLDGTAKGGIVIAIAKELGLPIKMIGIGEGYDDLRSFEPDDFVEAIFR